MPEELILPSGVRFHSQIKLDPEKVRQESERLTGDAKLAFQEEEKNYSEALLGCHEFHRECGGTRFCKECTFRRDMDDALYNMLAVLKLAVPRKERN